MCVRGGGGGGGNMTGYSKWGAENKFFSITFYNFPLPLLKPCVRGEPLRLVEGWGVGGGGHCQENACTRIMSEKNSCKHLPAKKNTAK